MDTQEVISQREFGRRLNVSEGTVRKAIDAGYIVQGRITKDSGKPALIYEIALQEWNNSPAGLQAEEKRKGPAPTPKVTTTVKNFVQTKSESQPDQKAGPVKPIFDPEAAAAKKEILKDKQTQVKLRIQKEALELQRLTKKLVDKEIVYRELFEFGKSIRDNIMTVPDRCIDELRNAKSRHEAHKILTDYLTEALRSLSATPNIEG